MGLCCFIFEQRADDRDRTRAVAKDLATGQRKRRVRGVVADAPTAPDEIVRTTGLTAASVAAALAELELLGLIAQADGRYREVMTQT